MPEITVNCFGICTHTKLEGFRRTILANVSDQARIDAIEELKKAEVHAHYASLTILNDDIAHKDGEEWPWWFKPEPPIGLTTEWRLKGVQIELREHEVHPDMASSACIPSLENLCRDRPINPLLTDPQATDPVNTAAYLHFPATELLGFSRAEGDAVYTSTVIQTPEDPVLHITRFQSTDWFDITIRTGAQIAVSNVPKEVGKPDDYLLHFFTTVIEQNVLPAHFPVEENVHSCAAIRAPRTVPRLLMPDMTGPGCSNTNYP